MTAITIKWDDSQFQAAFRRLSELGRDTSPLMADIAEGLLASTQDRFDSKVGPDGVPWAQLKASTLANKSGGGILVERGLLSGGIFPAWGADFAEISAPAFYARFHQEGTKPYTIRPKSGKALVFPGAGGKKVVRRSVKHPGLPARPFLGLSEADQQMVLDACSAALSAAFDVP